MIAPTFDRLAEFKVYDECTIILPGEEFCCSHVCTVRMIDGTVRKKSLTILEIAAIWNEFENIVQSGNPAAKVACNHREHFSQALLSYYIIPSEQLPPPLNVLESFFTNREINNSSGIIVDS